jgi:DNA-binding transcriptional LysR family regulator
MNTIAVTSETYVKQPNHNLGTRRGPLRRTQTMRGTQFAQLTAFAAVAKHRSFTRGAEFLGLSTPSLSQAIRSLEEEFGVRLLNRTTRSVALTEAGERLLGHLNPVFEGVDTAIDAISDFRDRPVGTLRLSVHPLAAATIIGPLVASFSSAYPVIGLEISVDLERKDIVGDRFDAGIHLGNSIAQDMIAVPIGGKLGLKTVASPDYLARNPVPEAPDDLRRHNCIRYRCDKDGLVGSWKFTKGNEQIDVCVDGSLTVNDLDLALRGTLDGVGIVQLPDISVTPLIADGRLVPVLADWSPQWGDFFLFYSSRRHVPTKLRAMIDFLKKGSRMRNIELARN